VREDSKNQLDAMFMCTNHVITVPIKKYTHDVPSWPLFLDLIN